MQKLYLWQKLQRPKSILIKNRHRTEFDTLLMPCKIFYGRKKGVRIKSVRGGL